MIAAACVLVGLSACRKRPSPRDLLRAPAPEDAGRLDLAEAPPTARRVIGDVKASGKPEPFVTVRLGTAGHVRSVVTDETGHFELAGVPPGAYAIAASSKGLAAFSGVDVGLEVEQGLTQARTVEVALLLEPTAPVGGIVRDAGGKPLAGAHVHVEELERPLPVDVDTAADGRFAVPGRIAGRTYRVTVRRAGFLPDGPRLARAGGPPLDVRLHPGASLDGVVVDEAGAPVANAEIAVVSAGADPDSLTSVVAAPVGVADTASGWSRLQPAGELGVLTGGVPYPPLTPLPAMAGPSAPIAAPLTPKSDVRGQFHLVELPSGRVVVTARHPDFASAASVPVTLEPGVTGHVRIELSRGARLLGRVLGEGTLGVADAQVTTSDGRTVLTDGAGRFVVDHVAGKVTITVRRQGYLRGQGSVEVASGQREVTLDVTLRRALGRLGGEVVDTAGRGVAGARLTIGAGEPQHVTTDGSGRFLVEGLSDGPYRVVIEHPEFAKLVLPAVEATAEARLVLYAGGGVEGELYDPRTGRAPLDAKLEWVSGDEHRALSLDGRTFHATALPVGPCRLVATARGYPRVVRAIEIGEASRPGEITVRDVRLEMELGGQVRGTVRDDRGDPLVGVEVRVIAPPDVTAPARTDRDGRFELDGVPAGNVRLEVRRGGERLLEDTTEVRSNEETRIELVAPEGR